jgi:hypothetical protein
MRCCTGVSESDSSTVGATAPGGATGLRPPVARDCALTEASESHLPASWGRYKGRVAAQFPDRSAANQARCAGTLAPAGAVGDLRRRPNRGAPGPESAVQHRLEVSPSNRTVANISGPKLT